jgi:hypothetical protein
MPPSMTSPRAGHQGRVVRGKEHDAFGDIVGCAHAFELA